MTQGSVNAVHDVDLSSAQTIDDVRRLIEDSSPGVRVRINSAGTGINVYNEVAGPGLSIEEVPGGANTATELGIRSYHAETATTELNDGRGVRIVDGSTNPVTGAPDPARDVDFKIHLGNGNEFTVDLRSQDMTNIQSVIDRINAEAGAAMARGDIPPGSFSAGLTDGANGIAFNDPLALGAMTVEKQNNSAAADDLGLMAGTYDATSATFIAQDRATVRVQNVLTTLMDLRDALRNNDSDGITLAGSQLDQHIDRLNATHGLVGVYGQRVAQAGERQEDLDLLDRSSKSQLQDLDFTDATLRYNVLQTQLQAAMTVGARAQSTSLLDFLG
jgi:flagellin-like hook-associated protein FlgL